MEYEHEGGTEGIIDGDGGLKIYDVMELLEMALDGGEM